MKDYFKLFEEDFFSPEKMKEVRSDAILSKYINVANDVIDKKRDEEVSKILFDKKGADMKKLIETVDYYDEFKKKFEADFRKKIKVKFAEK